MSLKAFAAAGTIAAALVSLAGQASATPVYDTDVGVGEFVGTRSIAGGGLINGGGTFTSGSLSWIITSNFDGSLHYSYSLSTNSQQGIGKFIWDLSDDCTAVGACFQNLAVTTAGPNSLSGSPSFGTFTSANGNPGMPGSITGVTQSISSGAANIMLEFDSNRVPVWADFYAKGGNPDGGEHQNGFSIFNAGLSFEATDTDTNHFAPMPDNVCTNLCGPQGNNVPEPSSTALFGAGLLGFVFLGRRRKRAARSA